MAIGVAVHARHARASTLVSVCMVVVVCVSTARSCSTHADVSGVAVTVELRVGRLGSW